MNWIRRAMWVAAIALLASCSSGAGIDSDMSLSPPPMGGSPGVPEYCDGVMLSGSVRWCNNLDGTVKDMSTGRVWLRDAGCSSKGGKEHTYYQALDWAKALSDGSCGLAEGSSTGSWSVPTLEELTGLVSGNEPVGGAGAPRLFLFQNLVSWPLYWAIDTFYDRTLLAGYSVLMKYAYVFPMRISSIPGTANVLPVRRISPATAEITSGKSYALAPVGATVPVPGATDAFTYRFLTQDYGQYWFNASYVKLWDWDESYRTYRIWYFEEDAANPGFFRIYSQPWLGSAWDTRRYLAVQDANTYSGVNVVAWPAPGGDNHLWKPLVIAGTNMMLVQNKNSGKCLDFREGTVNGSSLVQNPCTMGSSWQTFFFMPRQ